MSGTVTLHFLGRAYDLRADDPEDDVAEVVRYVEGVMAETENRHSGLNPQKLMVLAALHMGRDYIREKMKNAELEHGMKDASRRISSRIDQILEE